MVVVELVHILAYHTHLLLGEKTKHISYQTGSNLYWSQHLSSMLLFRFLGVCVWPENWLFSSVPKLCKSNPKAADEEKASILNKFSWVHKIHCQRSSVANLGLPTELRSGAPALCFFLSDSEMGQWTLNQKKEFAFWLFHLLTLWFWRSDLTVSVK